LAAFWATEGRDEIVGEDFRSMSGDILDGEDYASCNVRPLGRGGR